MIMKARSSAIVVEMKVVRSGHLAWETASRHPGEESPRVGFGYRFRATHSIRLLMTVNIATVDDLQFMAMISINWDDARDTETWDVDNEGASSLSFDFPCTPHVVHVSEYLVHMSAVPETRTRVHTVPSHYRTRTYRHHEAIALFKG